MTRARFAALIETESFLQRALGHLLSHRVQDFTDPLTSTLVLMATTPVQLVLCETGLLLFRTNLLTVLPYKVLTADERQQLTEMIRARPAASLQATMEPSGQCTLTVFHATNGRLLPRKQLLIAFVELMLRGEGSRDTNRRLCDIILQRFIAQVTTPADIVTTVVQRIQRKKEAEVEMKTDTLAAAVVITA